MQRWHGRYLECEPPAIVESRKEDSLCTRRPFQAARRDVRPVQLRARGRVRVYLHVLPSDQDPDKADNVKLAQNQTHCTGTCTRARVCTIHYVRLVVRLRTMHYFPACYACAGS